MAAVNASPGQWCPPPAQQSPGARATPRPHQQAAFAATVTATRSSVGNSISSRSAPNRKWPGEIRPPPGAPAAPALAAPRHRSSSSPWPVPATPGSLRRKETATAVHVKHPHAGARSLRRQRLDGLPRNGRALRQERAIASARSASCSHSSVNSMKSTPPADESYSAAGRPRMPLSPALFHARDRFADDSNRRAAVSRSTALRPVRPARCG